MPIQYDKLNEVFAMLRTLRQACIDGYITKEELDAALAVVLSDIRELLGFSPIWL